MFPFTTELRTLLERRRALVEKAQRDSRQIITHVFVRMVARGRRGPKEPKPILRFEKAWKAAATAVDYPWVLIHDMRRSAIRNLVRVGVSDTVATKLSGHKTRSVFDRYNVTSPTDLVEAAAKLYVLSEVGSLSAQSSGRL